MIFYGKTLWSAVYVEACKVRPQFTVSTFSISILKLSWLEKSLDSGLDSSLFAVLKFESKVGFWTIDSIVVLNFLLEIKTKLNPDLSQTSHKNENLHEDEDDVSVISSNCSYIVDTTKHSYHDYDDGQWETE